jgi:hypothetical protein
LFFTQSEIENYIHTKEVRLGLIFMFQIGITKTEDSELNDNNHSLNTSTGATLLLNNFIVFLCLFTVLPLRPLSMQVWTLRSVVPASRLDLYSDTAGSKLGRVSKCPDWNFHGVLSISWRMLRQFLELKSWLVAQSV